MSTNYTKTTKDFRKKTNSKREREKKKKKEKWVVFWHLQKHPQVSKTPVCYLAFGTCKKHPGASFHLQSAVWSC